jgi:dolichyl-phosphate beta-glucosyltransferase
MMPANATMERNALLRRVKTPRSIEVHPLDHDLTVIIPAYNEEHRLPWTLEQLTSYLADWGIDYRVVVADDGSTDGTAKLAEKFGPRCSTLRLMRQGGKGRAVRTAMLRATGEIVAFTDADLPFDLSALRQGYDSIQTGLCQVAFGARDLAESTSKVKRHFTRSLATRLFRGIVKTLLSSPVNDTQCGLKIFERHAALEIFSRATIDGFAFDAEVVHLTHRLGYRFECIPVTLINDYASTLSLRRNTLPMLTEIVRLSLRMHFGELPQSPRLNFLELREAFIADPSGRTA